MKGMHPVYHPMQANNNKHSEDDSPVRKLLRKLLPVPASDDFERRLQRRIAVEREQRLKKVPFYRRPLPAIAYSVATILVVSLVSYYAFLREGVPTVPTLEERPVPAGPSSGVPRVKEGEGMKEKPPASRTIPGRAPEKKDIIQEQPPEIKPTPEMQQVVGQPTGESNKGAEAATIPAPVQKIMPGLEKSATSRTVPTTMYHMTAPMVKSSDSTAGKDSLGIDSSRSIPPVKKKR